MDFYVFLFGGKNNLNKRSNERETNLILAKRELIYHKKNDIHRLEYSQDQTCTGKKRWQSNDRFNTLRFLGLPCFFSNVYTTFHSLRLECR